MYPISIEYLFVSCEYQVHVRVELVFKTRLYRTSIKCLAGVGLCWRESLVEHTCLSRRSASDTFSMLQQARTRGSALAERVR